MRPRPLRHRLLEPLLHLGFALTGVGTVLLGCILPRLSAQWHLRDKDAGLLLLVQFAASASGALLVRRNLWKALACGYGLFAAGGISIFLLQQKSLPAFAIYGLGLGLAMTSTNMLAGRRYPKRMGLALALQNFSWSAGAVACPLLVAQFLRHATSSARPLACVGFLALPFALLPLLQIGVILLPRPAFGPAPAGIKEATTIVYFALLAFLYVGMEASVGNWMSTYATRATAWTFAGSSLAVAVFWAALLLGRAIDTGDVGRFLTERRLYRASVIADHSGNRIAAGGAQSTRTAGRIGSHRACPGAVVPAHPLAVSRGNRRVAQRRLGLCRRGPGRSRALLVDGDRFQRYRLAAHRPDGARRRCPADDGLDHLAPNQSGNAKDGAQQGSVLQPTITGKTLRRAQATAGSWQGSCV